MAGEERRVAEQHIEDEPLVRLRARLGEGVAVAEVHGDVAHLHPRARHLGAEADGDALVGLHPDDERVLPEGRRLVLREQVLRRALEHDRDLRHATTEALARTQVERHARPAARVDVEPHGRVRLGQGLGVHAVLVEEAHDLLAALPAAGVLPACRGGGEVLRQAHRGQHLLLLVPEARRVERDGLLHGREGEELQEVVLDHVARRADAVVVAGTAAHADVLGHGDLHVVHVVGVPQGLVELVREAQRQDVLDRLLAQVVVDAEHRVRREDRLDDGVELACRLEVAPEGLLDDDAAPVALLLVREARAAELLGDQREGLRRDRQVERVVPHRAPLAVELLRDVLQRLERLVVVEGALHEADALRQLAPDVLVELGARVLLDGLVHDLLEVLVLPVPPGEADEREAGGQEPPVGEVVDRRHQLLARQVTRHAEDDEAARPRDAVQPSV